MRVKFNPLAESSLLNSEYVIKDFPYILHKNTVLELGMGKGEMLCKLANNSPQTYFIGIEKNATIANKANILFKKNNIKNIKIIAEDIVNLPSILRGTSKLIYITFPDPWPKNRHEKRRLTSKKFLLLYRQILSNDGMIKFKTDNDKLYQYTVDSLVENGWNVIYKTRDLHGSMINLNNFETGYEKKWSKMNKNIYYIEAKYNGK